MDKEYILYHLNQRVKGLEDWNKELMNQIKENNALKQRTKKTIVELEKEDSVNNIKQNHEQVN